MIACMDCADHNECRGSSAVVETATIAQATAHCVGGYSWRALAAGQILVAYLPTSTLVERMRRGCGASEDAVMSSPVVVDEEAVSLVHVCDSDGPMATTSGPTGQDALLARHSPHLSVVMSAWIAAPASM